MADEEEDSKLGERDVWKVTNVAGIKSYTVSTEAVCTITVRLPRRSSCWDILVWTKVVDQQPINRLTNTAIPRPILLAWTKTPTTTELNKIRQTWLSKSRQFQICASVNVQCPCCIDSIYSCIQKMACILYRCFNFSCFHISAIPQIFNKLIPLWMMHLNLKPKLNILLRPAVG